MQRRRLPASPNKPPPAPPKIVPKGQPVPFNINLLVQGNNVGLKSQRVQSAHYDAGRLSRSVGISRDTKLRPHSAHVDKHLLRSLKMPQSVDHSFYDRFERLDRDTVVGEMAIKEKGTTTATTTTRARSAGRQRTKPSRVPSAKNKKRSQSANCTSRKPMKNELISIERNPADSFFNLAMSFDDETAQNTLSNAKRQISPRTLGIESTSTENVSKRRPRSAKKSRDRSLSSKRSETSDNRSVIGSASTRSNRSVRKEKVDKPEGKIRNRTSRSRTRRMLPKCPDVGTGTKKSNPERNTSSAKSGIRSSRRSSSASDIVNNSLIINHIDIMPTRPFSAKQDEGGAYAYEYLKVGRNTEKRNSSAKRSGAGLSAIDAVKKANEVKETLNQMKEIDKLMFPEARNHVHVSSKYPKLKMIVAPTAMPLASYIRNTSAKILMSNAFDSKRKPVNV